MDDVDNGELWGQFMAAHEDAIRQISREEASWFLAPADHRAQLECIAGIA